MSSQISSTRRGAVSALVFAILLAAAGVSTGTPLPKLDKSAAQRLPRKFVGTYQWRSQNSSYEVTMVIERVEVGRDGVLTVQGHATHQVHRMKVKGTLDPKTRKVTLMESEPEGPRAEFTVVDGSYEGEVSEDFAAITAVWTTTSTGAKGDLKLKKAE